MLKEEPNMRNGPYGFHDKVFANEMNKLMNATDVKYNAMLFREVLREGFFGMIDAKFARNAKAHFQDCSKIYTIIFTS